MKLGKLPGRAAQRALRLENYLPPALAPAPVSVDWGTGIADWGPMGNLECGNCVVAAFGHAIMAWTVAAGALRRPSDDDVVAFYAALSGYVAGDPLSDRGAVIADGLDRWRNTGLAGDMLTAAAKIDITQIENLKRTIALLGCADLGVTLPASAQTQAVWDVVPDDGGVWGGHSILAVSYDLDGVTCITWGAPKRMTWGFITRYADEAWALVSRDFLTAAGVTPGALNLDQMAADLAALKSTT